MYSNVSWAQKRTAKENRERIITTLSYNPLTFTELRKKVGLSKPVLSNHLKFLRKKNLISKDLLGDKIVYRLLSGAYQLPVLHSLIFGDGSYGRIINELVTENDLFSKNFVYTSTTIYRDEKRLEQLLGSEPTPEFISEKNEAEIIKAIDKWISPIILFAIIQELKTGDNWTESANSVIQQLKELIKQKDLNKFEENVKSYYSEHRVPEHHIITSSDKMSFEGEISIIESLEQILEWIQIQELLKKRSEQRQREILHPKGSV